MPPEFKDRYLHDGTVIIVLPTEIDYEQRGNRYILGGLDTRVSDPFVKKLIMQHRFGEPNLDNLDKQKDTLEANLNLITSILIRTTQPHYRDERFSISFGVGEIVGDGINNSSFSFPRGRFIRLAHQEVLKQTILLLLEKTVVGDGEGKS